MKFEKLIPNDIAYTILEAYMHYYLRFKRITKRGKIRFENRDWQGLQEDMRARTLLYREVVGSTADEVKDHINDFETKNEFWARVRQLYFEEIRNFHSRNIAETFFNSVFRHLNQGLSADEKSMFVFSTGTYREFKSLDPIYFTFDFSGSIVSTVKSIIDSYQFDAPYEDLERDIGFVSKTLENKLTDLNVDWRFVKIELLRSVFYRNKAAYIVGRMYIHDSPLPFVLPILHQKSGLFIDALLLELNDVPSIFSYHRAYFLVDVDIVSETVDFLASILPTKRLSEIYNSIGFEKHGKTVFFRDFQRHLVRSNDNFITAPGIKGMVMLVFTLPSYNMVFKVIKDRFEAPKNITQEEVKEKYDLVSQYDRVGRLTDSHMFEYLVFDVRRFDKELLDDLRNFAPTKISINGNSIKINHLYVEKRMEPLNLYLETASKEDAYDVINDYGRAIKELASINIFPGDLLLKNFGVTRLKRVVFYDYDEIGFLVDYKFRRIPEPKDDYEAFSDTPFFYVGPYDIFPEEFPNFLIGNQELKKIFFELHGDLYDISFWRGTQEKIRQGKPIDFFPYNEKLRFSQL